VGAALGELADDLTSAGELATARENRLTLMAARLAVVVRMADEVSGSLSIRHVSEAATSAAAELLGAPATLWLPLEDGRLRVAHRSADPHGRLPRSTGDAPEVVTRRAEDARARTDAESRAYPLVLAGALVGVLHVAVLTADEDAEQILEALLSTAATALESARLNRAARERADIDPVTQLPNRWRLDADLEAEWERCARYDRPLSFVMIDLDRFKQLNDRYGHPLGDTALHAAGAAITAGLRITDTTYRYGGEEFAVLLRETGAEAAAELAERLRAEVAAVIVPGSDVAVTASLGVAERTPDMTHAADLVTAADAALYTAKRSGRNQVAAAPGRSASTVDVA
jgi:diguanylate cyclase (GGDEF)-like protein